MRLYAWGLLVVTSGCVLPPQILAGTLGSRVHFMGGTVASLPSKSEGHIKLTEEDSLVIQSKGNVLRIPYQKINVLEYGQRVDRRFAEAILISPLLLLSKKRKHFLTLGYADENGRQQAIVFQVHKGAVRTILASLEAKTGRRIEFQDQEARKAGKG